VRIGPGDLADSTGIGLAKYAEIPASNYGPNISLDEYINLKGACRENPDAQSSTWRAPVSDNVLTFQKARELPTAVTSSGRKRRGSKLEERQDGHSITDLGLNDFRMDLLN